jgi:hypothetical protein
VYYRAGCLACVVGCRKHQDGRIGNARRWAAPSRTGSALPNHAVPSNVSLPGAELGTASCLGKRGQRFTDESASHRLCPRDRTTDCGTPKSLTRDRSDSIIVSASGPLLASGFWPVALSPWRARRTIMAASRATALLSATPKTFDPHRVSSNFRQTAQIERLISLLGFGRPRPDSQIAGFSAV